MSTEQTDLDLLQQTVSDILAQRIRGEIIQGNFRPGERLRLRDLADRYKISTMPVREALQMLQTEGLVTGEARKGVTVAQLSVADVEDIYEIRATLEALATRLATPHVTATLLDKLRSITVEMIKRKTGAIWSRWSKPIPSITPLSMQFRGARIFVK